MSMKRFSACEYGSHAPFRQVAYPTPDLSGSRVYGVSRRLSDADVTTIGCADEFLEQTISTSDECPLKVNCGRCPRGFQRKM